jgi:3-hydroxyacyl-[acyl-carrier-protein] dehydratase
MRLEYFEMIDRVLTVDHDRLVAECRVPPAEGNPVFAGHMPGYPLMPGVLLIETMAQASGYLLLHRLDYSRMPLLASVKEAKLRSFVLPEATLQVEATMVHEGSGYAVAAARITSNGKRVCEAELTLRALPFPAPNLANDVRIRARSLGMPVEVAAA